MKKAGLILTIVLVITFMVTLTASATQPIEVASYFDQFVIGDPTADPPIPTTYCFHTGESWGVPDGFLTGCAVAYITPGLGNKAIWTGEVDGKQGTCMLNVRKFLHGQSQVVMNRCTGDLAGFHMLSVGSAETATAVGYYHFDP